MPSSLRLRLKLVLGPDTALGPGKADLLEAIEQTGSIAAAGRQLGMSYKRAWLLVETMNGCFKTPLVTSVRGGKGGGVAQLTPAGKDVLQRFRNIEKRSLAVNRRDIDALNGLAKFARKSRK
ncbi:MAG: winged helix-turn-helix domain-containing protein [Hyphomicrobiales bacterium]